MKLVPEQLESIERELAEKRKMVGDKDYLEAARREILQSLKSEGSNRDDTTEMQMFKAHADIRTLKGITGDCEIVDTPTGSVIEIGSNFTVEFSSGAERSFVLVEIVEGLDNPMGYATVESPFGQSVIGKTVDDDFSYTVGSSKREISGTIKSINTKEKTASKAIVKKLTRY